MYANNLVDTWILTYDFCFYIIYECDLTYPICRKKIYYTIFFCWNTFLLYIFVSQGLQSTPPSLTLAHVKSHLLDFDSCIPYNDIILAKKFISPPVKICTQLTENSKYSWKNHSVLSWQSLMAIPITESILHLHFSYKTHVFATHILICCSYRWRYPDITLTVWPTKSGQCGKGWREGEADCNTWLANMILKSYDITFTWKIVGKNRTKTHL